MKYLITLLLSFMVFKANSQDVTYYQHQPTGKISTQERYDAQITLNQEKLVTSGATDYYLKEIDLGTINRNDSIIKLYDLKFVRDLAKVFERESKMPGTIVGKTFNYKNLIDVDKQPFDVESLKGKPTMINAWFVECPPCVEELPALNELMERYKDKVNFVSLTFDTPEKVSKFLEKKDFNFKHIVSAGFVLQNLNIMGYPDNIFLDKNNMIVASFVKVMNYKKDDGTMVENDVSRLEEYLDYLIAQQ
ncbi:MAG: TlpA family protein disulfide reductase [Nonlabens sp.]|nr:TlpA family protein disulfide reductase [Nonlabens sp.]